MRAAGAAILRALEKLGDRCDTFAIKNLRIVAHEAGDPAAHGFVCFEVTSGTMTSNGRTDTYAYVTVEQLQAVQTLFKGEKLVVGPDTSEAGEALNVTVDVDFDKHPLKYL